MKVNITKVMFRLFKQGQTWNDLKKVLTAEERQKLRILSTVGMLSNSTNISDATARKIARHLNCSVNDILTGTVETREVDAAEIPEKGQK